MSIVPPKRVLHAKFGRGNVTREFNADKLEVVFDSGEKKVILTRFLTRLPD